MNVANEKIEADYWSPKFIDIRVHFESINLINAKGAVNSVPDRCRWAN